MNSDSESQWKSEESTYEVTLGFLGYDSSQSSKLSFPMRIRERHLTPGPSEVELQAVGPELQVSVWSERDNILLRMPLKGWKSTKPYDGKLTGPNNGLLSVGRFADDLETVEYPEDGSRGVSAHLSVHDYKR